ncbi:hypothetical protein EJB05_01679 [Eragrostis curvula]|uniref:Uncharacterized protein n=1 Tax=Eragrostis curvula TaxID=38414 RepID=A0A5J9T117_9POAL|nr:hypothetical protein EJB05_47622 [Eragrostis curvula]TVU50312.1 hypothetical protein EJB05_01679 [Eragrostis curvula]
MLGFGGHNKLTEESDRLRLLVPTDYSPTPNRLGNKRTFSSLPRMRETEAELQAEKAAVEAEWETEKTCMEAQWQEEKAGLEAQRVVLDAQWEAQRALLEAECQAQRSAWVSEDFVS